MKVNSTFPGAAIGAAGEKLVHGLKQQLLEKEAERIKGLSER